MLLMLNNIKKCKSILFTSLFLFFVLLIFIILMKQKNYSVVRRASFPPEKYVPNQIVVKYASGKSPEELEKAIQTQPAFFEKLLGAKSPEEILQEEKDIDAKAGVVLKKKVFSSNNPSLSRYYLLFLKSGSDVKKVQDLYLQNNFINKTEPNFIYHAFDITPNDTYFGQMWALTKIQMPKAWINVQGSKDVIVAVVDSGIDYNQPDLPTDIIKGYNFADGNNDPMDYFGHGTHIAGTIGAITNNNIGVSGIDWNTTLMAVKVLGADGSGNAVGIVQGIQYSVDHGAKVINLSLGAEVPCSYFPMFQDVINYAIQKGSVVVTAAGNSTIDANTVSPASCIDNITVGATTPTDSRAIFSNYGSRVDISAPGTQILSTKAANCSNLMCVQTAIIGNNYLIAQGTSMATPHVAAVAALIFSLNPSFSAEQVKNCLIQGADRIVTDLPIGPRLNANGALQLCTPTPTPTLTPNINSLVTPTPPLKKCTPTPTK